jgi:hypothetical protein
MIPGFRVIPGLTRDLTTQADSQDSDTSDHRLAGRMRSEMTSGDSVIPGLTRDLAT